MPAIFIATLVTFQVLLIFVHLTVYATLSAAFGFDGMAMRVIFILLSLTFVASSLIVRWSRNRLAQWFYTFAGYWFGLVHFLFAGGVIFFFTLVIANAFQWSISPAIVGEIWFGFFFLLHLYGTWNSWRAEITRVSISIPNMPEFWKRHQLVFISDIHLGAVRGAKFMRKIVSRIQALNPALVLIGGDLYDGVKCDAEAVIEPLRDLKPIHGVHYITGNHEFYGELERYLAAIRGMGVHILKNEKVEIEGLQIVGVDYHDTHKRENFMAHLSDIPLDGNKPSILIKHEPDNLDVAEQKGFSAGFFGHTHRGQIFPLSYITKRMYHGFDYGLKQFKKMWMYTSSGVGTWGPPLRLGTRSEVVLVTFV
jgi:uncharacterized protein